MSLMLYFPLASRPPGAGAFPRRSSLPAQPRCRRGQLGLARDRAIAVLRHHPLCLRCCCLDVAFSLSECRTGARDWKHARRQGTLHPAVQSKDARFDGWFFTAVQTTGIYCRPSCPVVPPKPANMRFYPSAAAAQQAGYRACKRCRPDASPGSPLWNERADLVARAMRLIADGVIDAGGVPALAARLGYSV